MQRTARKRSLQSDKRTTSQCQAIHWRNMISPAINFQHKNGPQSPFSACPAPQFLPPLGKWTLIAEHLCYTTSVQTYLACISSSSRSKEGTVKLAPSSWLQVSTLVCRQASRAASLLLAPERVSTSPFSCAEATTPRNK